MALLAVMAISRLVLMAAIWCVAVIRSEELPAGSAPTMFSSLIWHIQKASLLVWGETRDSEEKRPYHVLPPHLAAWPPAKQPSTLTLHPDPTHSYVSLIYL